jgi:hypothetical protein
MRRGALLATLLLFARSAVADGAHPAVRLEVEGCGDAPSSEIRRIVGIELRATLDADDATPAADTTHVRVTCAERLAELTVDDAITGKSLSRSIDIEAASPNSRARLIALAVAELVSASWTELETPPTVPPAGPRPSPAAVGAAREAVHAKVPRLAPRSFRVVVAGSVRAVLGETVLYGANARAAYGDAEHPIGYRLDLGIEHGTESTALGSVGIDSAGAAAALLFHAALPGVFASGHAGAGARYGYAWLAGQPANASVRGETVTGSWLGPLATAGLTLAPGRTFRADLDLEAGYALLAVTGHVTGAADAGIRGAWLGALLGVGLVP